MADSIGVLARQGKVAGVDVAATYHDTGNQLKYLQATIDLALRDPRFSDEIYKFIKERSK